MACKLCGQGCPGDLCEECDLLYLGTNTIYGMYRSGSVEDWAKEFVRELDFTFRRDNRAIRYFEVANEIMLLSIGRSTSRIPISDLRALRDQPRQEIQELMEVLALAAIARLMDDEVILDDLGLRLSQLLPTGVPLISEEFRGPAEEVRGAICVALAMTLIDSAIGGNGSRRPRTYLLWMKRLSRHCARFLPITDPIDKCLWGVEFFERGRRAGQYVVGISPRQREREFADVVGLGGAPSKMIERIEVKPGGKFDIYLKDSVVVYLERLRERYRERERGR